MHRIREKKSLTIIMSRIRRVIPTVVFSLIAIVAFAGMMVKNAEAAGDSCSSTLTEVSGGYNLHIPIITYGNNKLNADLVYVPTTDGNIWFKVTGATLLTDTTGFNNCSPASLASDLTLNLPVLILGPAAYSIVLQYVAGGNTGTGTDIMFKVTDIKGAGSFTLTSTAFSEGQTIPQKYTYTLTGQCSGQNYTPHLAWSNAPGGVKSFVISVLDPDGGDWIHWVQFNIPASTTSLAEEINGSTTGIKGKNDFGENGYGGPCPPDGTHRYIFTLYALDTTLSLQEGATLSQVNAAMTGHILGQAVLTGLKSP